MSYRSDVINEALREWERYPQGRPDLYWQEVLNPYVPGFKAEWCGAFVLRTLKRAGLAKKRFWRVGSGFIEDAGLPVVRTPLPGDVAYISEPFQHEAIVVTYEPTTGMVTTIDGNQPSIKPKVRFVGNGGITFYSIEPLIKESDREASVVGYLVAGAILVGAAAWAWEIGVPPSIERALKRLAA